MVTVRCTGRAFRLLPHRKVVETVWYCLAATVAKYGLSVHEFSFLSNHYHLGITPLGDDLPAFMQDLNSLLSRALNALRSWSGSNFEGAYNITVQVDDRATVRQCGYILANPCAADLVSRISQWRGVHSYDLEYGETVTVKRPNYGLWKPVEGQTEKKRRRKGEWDQTRRSFRGRWVTPDEVSFKLTRPAVYEDELDDRELRQLIREEALKRQEDAEKARRKKGRRAMGMRRVLQQKWSDLPNSKEDLFGPEPKVAASSRWARQEALERDRSFTREYRACRRAWCAGDREVVFPAGTYQMRVRFGVRCANAPPG